MLIELLSSVVFKFALYVLKCSEKHIIIFIKAKYVVKVSVKVKSRYVEQFELNLLSVKKHRKKHP